MRAESAHLKGAIKAHANSCASDLKFVRTRQAQFLSAASRNWLLDDHERQLQRHYEPEAWHIPPSQEDKTHTSEFLSDCRIGPPELAEAACTALMARYGGQSFDRCITGKFVHHVSYDLGMRQLILWESLQNDVNSWVLLHDHWEYPRASIRVGLAKGNARSRRATQHA